MRPVQRRLVRFLGPLAAAALLASPLPAAEFNMNVTAAGIQPGGHVSGPMLAPETIANRVVLLEFWGLNCPPCIRSMPMLEELHTTLGPHGLVVIGAHAQGGAAAELKPQVAKLGVTFTILENANVEGGTDFQGIPHCILFDHTGKCIYRGSPFSAQEAVVAAVKAAPGSILEGRTLAKLPELNTLLRDERQFATVLKKARGLTSSGDAETADEAKFVVEKIEAYGRRLLDEARSGKETDPARAADSVQRCAVLFKGGAIGTEAAKLSGEWKKDKQFQAAVKAGQQLAKLEQMRDFVREQLGVDADATVTAEQAAVIPAAMKGQIRSLAQGIGKSCPGSSFADKAAAIAAELAPVAGTP
ncbi:MAG: TlpA family protein disulfide reductase [Planctomycetota bacterium]